MMADPAVAHSWTGGGRLDWMPFGCLAVLLLVELAGILALTDGQIFYSLDDPYIHLALAENIARGHYGVNLSEPSAASSSILWPALLVPFARTGFHDQWPLVINVLCAFASAGILQAIVRRGMPSQSPPFHWLRPLIVSLAAVGFNLVGLVFTGMEHSLQVLLALALVLALIIEAEERRLSWLLAGAIVIGPLVRYESLGLSLAAVLFLMLRGRPWVATGLAAGAALPLLAFSLFLRHLGLGSLPSSVTVKLQLAASDASIQDLLASLGSRLLESEGAYSRLVLSGFAVLFVWRAWRYRGSAGESSLAMAGAVMAAAHLAGGRFGWFGRYEVYVMISVAALWLYLWRGYLFDRIGRLSHTRAGVETGLAVLLLCAPTIGATLLTPLAAANIREQHYQMHRFVTEFHDGPVAVNDLGWVSYRNDDYVLDLWGLGSREAGIHRLGNTPGWMAALAEQKDVDLAMIYESWYGDAIPAEWLLLGRLHLGGMRVTAADDNVAFFAVDRVAAGRLARQIVRFAETLPPGVGFELAEAGRAALAGD